MIICRLPPCLDPSVFVNSHKILVLGLCLINRNILSNISFTQNCIHQIKNEIYIYVSLLITKICIIVDMHC